jgi:hypothetical protein
VPFALGTAFDLLSKMMTKLLEEAVVELRTLREDEQDRAAAALLAFTRDRQDYTLTGEQIEGIPHAMGQAEQGEFAGEKRLRRILGRSVIVYQIELGSQDELIVLRVPHAAQKRSGYEY